MFSASSAPWDRPCPCGGARYQDCCGPLHRGERLAQTPEELMRSRYSAYAVGERDYLLRTWHPMTRPAAVDLEDPGTLRWVGLVVHASSAPPEADQTGVGTVDFSASFERQDSAGRIEHGVLREHSRFERRGGRWLYRDGTHDEVTST